MWPFKKKQLPLCINCKHYQKGAGSPVCHRRKPSSIINPVDGKDLINDYIKYTCQEERQGLCLFWGCGKKGRCFKDKNKFS